jgi:DNA polymerase-3 subunit alpha
MATTPPRFVHLHLHSEYSLLDGGNRIDRLINRVKELGMDAVALTDHGNMHGAIQFYNKAKDAGIKAILGIEAYVAPDIDGAVSDRKDRTFKGVADGGFHLVLLAENLEGWRNLLKLSSDAFIHGYYFKPRMDKSTLAQWSTGLIAINGHLGSSIAFHLLRYEQTKDEKHWKTAVAEAKWHAQVFKPNANGEPCFFIELQRHEVQEQDSINPHLIRLARELNLPLVADNDAHFLLADDYDAHDVLCCISMGKTRNEPDRLRYPRQLYVKSPAQMAELFKDIPEAVENTAKIADRCNVKLDFSANHAPVVKVASSFKALPADSGAATKLVRQFKCEHPAGSTEWFKAFCAQVKLEPFDSQNDKVSPAELKQQCDGALRALAEAGAVWRYGLEGISDDIRARLERELKVLADKLISAYFLIVWDFVNEARRRGIPANARGSGVGTMVGYCLGLSNACPVQYGLLFERFTDPDRSEYPDIDIDICQDGRQEILEYVRQKYGYVAQIITFGTLKARAALRDVGRVLGVPLSDVDKLCKLVGDGLSTTLQSALDQEPDLRKLYDENPVYREMYDTARRLEGMSRHAGVHAAGVVIATQPLETIVPLYRPGSSENLATITQWDGPTCEKVGLLKMDFLGLRTLSIIERAKLLVRQSLPAKVISATVRREDEVAKGKPESDALDLERLRYDDPRVLDLFSRGETAGVFQFESPGMRNLLMAMKPDRLEDLIAANALYRPGPMDLIPDYNNRKHRRQAVPKVHAIVDQFTDETYGVMVYQEQVMQIVHGLGEIPLRAAYSLIKAISKKKQKDIDAVRPKFVEGAQKQGLTRQGAEELFELIMKFAGYGFNKSHSTGYAIVAYQTAYLKTFFPVQYMAALLTYESVSTEKVVQYIDECKRVMRPGGKRGIEVRPPHINLSSIGFNVVFDSGEPQDPDHGHIRFGLNAVKGVGDKAIKAIIEARDKEGPFKSIYDFCERVSLSSVNRATMEALVKCGAFDELHGPDQRAAMVQSLEGAIQAGQRAAADRDAGQLSFFDAFAAANEPASGGAGGTGGAGAAKSAPAAALPSVDAWPTNVKLQHELSVLGFYLSSHPLDEFRDEVQRFSNVSIPEIRRIAAEVQVTFGGILTRVRNTVVKNGKSAGSKMAMITVQDRTGNAIDGVVFSNAYAIAAPLLKDQGIVIIKGKVDRRREEPCVVVESVLPIERAPELLTETVKIVLREPANGNGHAGAGRLNGELDSLRALLRQASAGASGYGNGNGNGNGSHAASVCIEVHQAGQVVSLRLNQLRVRVSSDLPERIATVLRRDPRDCCELLGPMKLVRSGAGVLHSDDAPRQAALAPSGSHADGEFCASIDRY